MKNTKMENLFASIEEDNKKKETVQAIEVTLGQLLLAKVEMEKIRKEYIQARDDYRQMRDDFIAAKNFFSNKVNSLNTHIDNLITSAPTKLKLTLSVTDADRQDLQNRHNAHYNEMKKLEKSHLDSLSKLFSDYHDKSVEQARVWGENVRKTFHDYEGYCATGWVAHFCAFFFVVGLLCTIGLIGYLIAKVS